MRDPKRIYTQDGYENHCVDMKLLERILFKLRNDADDLHINENHLELISQLEKAIPTLLSGDGELDECENCWCPFGFPDGTVKVIQEICSVRTEKYFCADCIAAIGAKEGDVVDEPMVLYRDVFQKVGV